MCCQHQNLLTRTVGRKEGGREGKRETCKFGQATGIYHPNLYHADELRMGPKVVFSSSHFSQIDEC